MMSREETHFIKTISKSVVAEVVPEEARYFDAMADEYIIQVEQADEKETHLISDTAFYIVAALHFLWPRISRFISERSHAILEDSIYETVSVALTNSGLTQEIVAEITDSILKILRTHDLTKFASSSAETPTMPTILIMTPLPVEYEAVRKYLPERQKEIRNAILYEKGVFVGKYYRFNVILCEPGKENVRMALATSEAIRQVEPHIALLVGIAGGIKDVKIGDIVISTKVYHYETGKIEDTGFFARPAFGFIDKHLLAYAQKLSRESEWKKRTHDGAPGAKVHLGPTASGEKVMGSINNETFNQIRRHFNDALALEMEAIGFTNAIQLYDPPVKALMIRGISDLLDPKSDDTQGIAAERAAAFAFALLDDWKENLP